MSFSVFLCVQRPRCGLRQHPPQAGEFVVDVFLARDGLRDDLAQSGSPSPQDPEPRTQVPLSLPSRVALLAKVCDAVQVLHEHGVIHRDLKPSNILIDRHGEPIIIDLGIAAIFEEFGGGPQRTITEEGAPIGTPAFMSPEQARGERRRISTRSDVYSLGATAYLVLTGATPHDTNTTIHEAVRRVAQDEPRDPRALEPTLPKALSAVLARACAREPERRYASAAALASDLRRWLRGEPVEAQPPTPWQRAARWAGRNPVKTTAALSAVMGVIVAASTALITGWMLFRRPWDIALSADKTEARLVTFGGHVLRTWRSRDSYPILLAKVVPRPASMGGGKALVIVFHLKSETSHLAGKLCVWSLSRWQGEPEWMSPTKRDWPVPPREPMETDSTYGATYGLIADVFPDSPGDEIVLTMTQHESPNCIRVYDLAGSVLYEAWHRGVVGRMAWSESAGLLVLAGMDNRYRILEEFRWEDEHRHVRVLLALRPALGARPGQVNRELAFIRDPATGAVIDRGPPEQPETEWYLWLAPAPVENAPGIDAIVDLHPPVGGPANAFLIAKVRFSDGSHCQYLFDPLGEMVGRREVDSFLERHPRDTPDFVVFSREPPMRILRPARPDE